MSSADTLTVSITAHVETFCRIYPPPSDFIIMRGGVGEIGTVREVCNTPQGYDVRASFSNLDAGKLLVGGSAYAVVDGIATRSSSMAAVRTQTWSLADARMRDAAQPVVMQVTISPR